MDEFQERGSKWTLIIIHHLEININQYKPLSLEVDRLRLLIASQQAGHTNHNKQTQRL
jgi:hypothetical protein